VLKLEIKKPRKFISPLLSKKSITSDELDSFINVTNRYLSELEIQSIAKQSEPNMVSNALKPYFETLTYNAQSYSQKGQSGMDLALMREHNPTVIIEAKIPNSSAMITTTDINKKALHEAVLYFMRERSRGNNTIYHIIITDFYNWFIFDAKDFETQFWKNSNIKKIFDSVKDPSILGSRTEDFYDLIATQISEMKENLIEDSFIECAYFNLQDKRSNKENIALYKLLSKDTLLKAFNPNDANTLNKVFYSELLYILGLEEQKSGGKKLISRSKNPQSATLFENISRNLKLSGYTQEFEIIIRLMILWINRILFLKLLESQLTKWNSDDSYRFLNIETIQDFDKMKIFFFDILANKLEDRAHQGFEYIPYLNSSLFEINEIEQRYIDISSLEDNCKLPYYPKTILQDVNAKRKVGEANMLEYLFEFLDAYDFSSEGSEELVNENKSLINASVLGLIFEKLNGYKDGSFYTPSFITMYMSKETITKAIVEKFNHLKGWNTKSLDELDEKIEDKKEANEIINSLTICDPAVGSGHFLVSSLNTILEIKSQLRILYDTEGKRIKDYELSVENDELIVRDDDGEIFEYKRGSREKTRIQKMLFVEKQRIIENSLFGVDINPNSAQITRLRLWIELLKNSYYTEDANLITMPNIDINIKIGNSLISRYGLDDDIDIPNIKYAIEKYKRVVTEYKEGDFTTSKNDIRKAIDDVKGMFGLTLKAQWKQTENYKKELGKYIKEYGMGGLKRDIQLDALEFNYGYHGSLFEEELSITKIKEKNKLLDKVIKAHQAIEEIERGKIYEDAFEWRFEFPEVLDNEGNFIGFDVVIGNPPYIDSEDMLKTNEKVRIHISNNYLTAKGNWDIFIPFIELGINILKNNQYFSFILPNKVLLSKYGTSLRAYINNFYSITELCDLSKNAIFDVNVYPIIMSLQKINQKGKIIISKRKNQTFNSKYINYNLEDNWALYLHKDYNLYSKIMKMHTTLKNNKNYELYSAASVSEAYKIKEIIEDNNNYSDEYFKLINTGTIDPYINFWGVKKMSYIKDKYLYPIIDKRKIKLKIWSDKPKISIAGMGIRIESFLDQKGEYLPLKSTTIITAIEKEYLTAICGLLNSNLLSYIFRIANSANEMAGGYLNINKNNLNMLPIPNEFSSIKPLINSVDKIISLKKQNKDTADLEIQIDQMVYELYGLSDDEIAIVEGR